MSQKTSSKKNSHQNISQQDLQELIELNDVALVKAFQADEQCIKDVLQQIYHRIMNLAHNNDRKSFFKFLAIYYYNSALIMHRKEQSLDAVNAIQNCLKNYEYLKGFISSREENVVHTTNMIKIYLQSCAILSEIGNHTTAILYAEKTLQKLIECIRILHVICSEELVFMNGKELQTKDQFPKLEKICFKERVLLEAKRLLDELCSLPMIHKLLTAEKNHFEKVTQHIYFWKENYDQNEKIMRKQLEIDKKKANRNILGLHKISTIAAKFHIGGIMNMKLKKINSVPKTDRYYLLSCEKLMELVLFASVSYFTFATQTRFNEIEEDIDCLGIMTKYQKLHHDSEIKKCKIIHLKAIEIAAKHLPFNNDYLEHLIQSFNKNYKVILDEIEQVSQGCTFIENTQRIKPKCPSEEYGIIKKGKTKNKIIQQKSKAKFKKQPKKSTTSVKTLHRN